MLMDGSVGAIVWNFARNILGIFVGTAAVVGFAFNRLSFGLRLGFGAFSLAILIPPNAFPGADALDWVGLAGAVLVLAFNYWQTRAEQRRLAPQPAKPS